jgi:hypothetical protein
VSAVVEATDELQVARSQRERNSPRGRGVPVIPRRQPPVEEDESVELFFG